MSTCIRLLFFACFTCLCFACCVFQYRYILYMHSLDQYMVDDESSNMIIDATVTATVLLVLQLSDSLSLGDCSNLTLAQDEGHH
jgi:hypothetical protein